MPYIKPEYREKFLDLIEDSHVINDAGEANYFITCILLKYLERQGKSYQNINEVVGILECCKLEFYRRLAAPYESEKANSNGDVF